MEGKLNTISAMQEEQLREQKSPSAVARRSSEVVPSNSGEEEEPPASLEATTTEEKVEAESDSKATPGHPSDVTTLEYWQALFDDLKSGRKQVTLADVDVPSAVVGAAISATGFLLVLWLSDRR